MKPTIEDQFKAVKLFYERHYKDEKKRPIKFQSQPSDKDVRDLYEAMVKVQGYFKHFYYHNEPLWSRLEKRRGIAPQDVPDKKVIQSKDHFFPSKSSS